jgi:hypothetical protein
VYQRDIDGAPEFVEVPEPTDEAMQSVLRKIIIRTMQLLTSRGVLVEEEGSTYIANNDSDSDEARTLGPLQAAPGRWPLPVPGLVADCVAGGAHALGVGRVGGDDLARARPGNSRVVDRHDAGVCRRLHGTGDLALRLAGRLNA